MANLAAVLTAPKSPIQVRVVDKYTPGPHELLVKVEAIALNPFEAKLANLAMIPIQYPAILGYSFGGTVEDVGPGVTQFKAGDKVAASADHALASGGIGAGADKYWGFQRYVLVADQCAAMVPEGIDVAVPASLTGNLSTVVGLFTGTAGLDKPDFDAPAPSESKGKVLIYGGSSSVGCLSVQYVTQAGYSVITTSSPRNKALVDKFGATKVVDHTMSPDSLTEELVALGPYDLIVDCISLPSTIPVTAAVLKAQGGSKLYTLTGGQDGEVLPEGISRVFMSWPSALKAEKNAGLLAWAYSTYLTQAVARGKIVALPVQKVAGGLEGINGALDELYKGVSGCKLVVNPWE
jgi:NADPH:quinone reductase-like Zn-dependent oxidoreductase